MTPTPGPFPWRRPYDTAGTEKKKRHFLNGWFVCRRPADSASPAPGVWLSVSAWTPGGAAVSQWPDVGGTW